MSHVNNEYVVHFASDNNAGKSVRDEPDDKTHAYPSDDIRNHRQTIFSLGESESPDTDDSADETYVPSSKVFKY